MTSFLLLIALATGAFQETFTRFSFCRENSRGPFEFQCVELDPGGKGTFKFRPRDADTLDRAIELSAPVAADFVELVRETEFLREGDQYESNRRVANLGMKTLIVEGDWGRREAVFNFSSRREVTRLVTFFEQLISQELLVFDIDVALEFDRLSIPRRLDQVEKEMKAGRIVDPGRLLPLLDRIAGDQRLMNFARTTANRLKSELQKDN